MTVIYIAIHCMCFINTDMHTQLCFQIYSQEWAHPSIGRWKTVSGSPQKILSQCTCEWNDRVLAWSIVSLFSHLFPQWTALDPKNNSLPLHSQVSSDFRNISESVWECGYPFKSVITDHPCFTLKFHTNILHVADWRWWGEKICHLTAQEKCW